MLAGTQTSMVDTRHSGENGRAGEGRAFTRGRSLWLAAMLLTLHAAVVWEPQAWWARLFALAHFGFFLLWQPLWRQDEPLPPSRLVLVTALAAAVALFAHGWLMAVWLSVLIGLIGASALGEGERRIALPALLATAYCLGLLLVWVVPHLFPDSELPPAVVALARFGLLGFLLPLPFLPAQKPRPVGHAVDFIYSLLLFLLAMVLVLSSFAFKVVVGADHLFALAAALVAVGMGLMVIAWLWQPRRGFSGFGTLLSRWLLSVGLPFEAWLADLARLFATEADPRAFLRAALAKLARLPWVSGGSWRSVDEAGEFGQVSAHTLEIAVGGVAVDLYTHHPMPPALAMHTRLLVELIAAFHEAKRREAREREEAYLAAIHATGARLTHDVKNLLQSLTTLCAAAEHSPEDDESLGLLMRRQLPLVTERLAKTLDKFKAPQAMDARPVSALAWWEAFRARHGEANLDFELVDGGDVDIPGDLFDSVADNLVANALAKRASEPEIAIHVRFHAGPRRTLSVCDSGASVPPEVASRLLAGPVPSARGMGIGLYQAARQAESLGFRLELTSNETGRVCFELKPALRLVVSREA